MKRVIPESFLVAALCMCTLASVACTGPPAPEMRTAATALVHVDVVPMDQERVLRDHTVVVLDGRIVAVGPAEEVEIPEGAAKIDGSGKYLMPGLADMHVHPDYPDQLLLFVANGVTTIRNMHGGPKYLEWKQRVANEEFLAPYIYTTGPLIDAPPGRVPGSVLVDTPEEARLAVIDQKEAGFDYIKVLGGLSLEVYDAVIDESAKQELRVVGHVPPVVGLDHAVRAGQLSIEHMDGIAQAAAKDDSPLEDPMAYYEAWKHVDARKVPRVGELLATQGTWVCPTLVSWQSDPMPDEIESFLQRPEARFVHPETVDYWKSSALPAEFVQVLRDGVEGRMLTVRLLHEAGVRLVLGTDSPAGFVLNGFGTLRELEILVDAGLSPYEAIEMATRNAAELVGASQEFGTIAIGRRADLLLVEANPLDDVSNVSKRAGVMVRGHWYEQSELDAKLDSLATKYEKQMAEADREARRAAGDNT